VTSSLVVFEVAMWVKSMYMTKSLLQSRKEKIWKSKNFLHKPPCNGWLRNRIHSLLNRADAEGSADIISRM